jgi:hypothetical protein
MTTMYSRLVVGVAAMLLTVAALAAVPLAPDSSGLPSQHDISLAEHGCAGNLSDVQPLDAKLDAALAVWEAAAGSPGAQARKGMQDTLEQFKKDSNLSPVKTVYVTCIENALLRSFHGQQSAPGGGALVDESALPSPQAVEAMEQTCANNFTGVRAAKAPIDAAITQWRSKAATGSMTEAQQSLESAFESIRFDGPVTPQVSLCVACVKKALKQYLTTQADKPRPVDGVAVSQPQSRAAFGSDQDMWRGGCKQAEDAAVATLRASCGERTFVPTTTDCTEGSGDPRTYTAQVAGECRVH